MEVRSKKNPRLRPEFERGGYKLCYRAEYLSANGKWYPCYDRRYNVSKRQATRQANQFKQNTHKISFRPTPSTVEDITFTLVGAI